MTDREVCGNCDGLIDDDGKCACPPQRLIGCVQHDCERCKADTALLRQALEALEHHVEQTRPIHRTSETIAALRERLGEKK